MDIGKDILADLADFENTMAEFEQACEVALRKMHTRFGYQPDNVDIVRLLQGRVAAVALELKYQQDNKEEVNVANNRPVLQ